VFSAVALAIMMVSFFGIVFLMSFYFQSVAGFSPLIAGVWVAPLPLALGIVNPISGRLFDRFSRPAIMAIVGAVIVIGAVFLLSSALKDTSPGLAIALLLAVIGVGGGLVWSPTIAGALAFSRPEMRGVANGTAFTMIYVGFATSVSLVVSVSTSSLPAALSAAIQSGALTGLTGAAATSFDQGLVNALLVLAVVGIVGVPLLFLVLREQVRQRKPPTQASSESAAPVAAM